MNSIGENQISGNVEKILAGSKDYVLRERIAVRGAFCCFEYRILAGQSEHLRTIAGNKSNLKNGKEVPFVFWDNVF